MNRIVFAVLGLSGLVAGCPSVHTLRGAEVMPVGKTETVAHVGMNGVLVSASATAGDESESGSAAGLLPFAAFSYRTGVADRVDVQVKAGLDIFPEISAAYQFIGTPGEGGNAVSASIGVKWFSMSAGDESASVIYLPVALLADLPLGTAKLFIKGGATVIAASGGDSSDVSVKPMVGFGARVKLGGMTLMPELGYMHMASLSESSEEGDVSAAVDAGLLAFGLGFAF
jgi:hypothetical protein